MISGKQNNSERRLTGKHHRDDSGKSDAKAGLPATAEAYGQPLTQRPRKRRNRFHGRTIGETQMKSLKNYWPTRKHHPSHGTVRRPPFLSPFLRRSALALLTFSAIGLATVSTASAISLDPGCMFGCNGMAMQERYMCDQDYDSESTGWHECQFGASANWFSCRSSCIIYSAN
jgi:hypothetical protein